VSATPDLYDSARRSDPWWTMGGGNRPSVVRILRAFPLHEHIMRTIRIAILLAVAATAFTACKKGGGYMTEPTPAVASN
jgi:hypothetical protein